MNQTFYREKNYFYPGLLVIAGTLYAGSCLFELHLTYLVLGLLLIACGGLWVTAQRRPYIIMSGSDLRVQDSLLKGSIVIRFEDFQSWKSTEYPPVIVFLSEQNESVEFSTDSLRQSDTEAFLKLLSSRLPGERVGM